MSRDDLFADADRFLAGFDFARMSAAQEEKHRRETEALLLGLIEIADSLRDLERHSGELVARGHEEIPHKSVRLLVRKVLKLLAQAGVRPMNAVGEALDLNRHEVVEMRVGPSAADDVILEEIVDGYLWNDRTLRRARVVVSRPEAEESGESAVGGSGEPS